MMSLPETKLFESGASRLRDSELYIDFSQLRLPDSHDSSPRPEAAESVAAINVSRLRPGFVLGNYEISRRIGRGGMGVVYQALDRRQQRRVALKLMREDIAEDLEAVARFLGEAEVAGRIDHPNTVRILEVGRCGHLYFQVMELVTGGTLHERIRRHGPLPWPEATRLAIQVCRGLAAAHAVGVVHRDIKPENLVLTEHGDIKIADFGLAKCQSARHKTVQGMVLGTVHYMSPEQCNAELVDGRTDTYSLGATYYTMLCGKRPYAGRGSSMQVMYAHCHHLPPDPCRVSPQVPAACAKLVRHAMAKRPASRFQTADEMRQALEELFSMADDAG